MSKLSASLILLIATSCGGNLANQRHQKKQSPGSTQGLPVFNGQEALVWKMVADGVKLADTFYYNLATTKSFAVRIETPVPAKLKVMGHVGEQLSTNVGDDGFAPTTTGRHGLIISLNHFGGAYKGPYLIILENTKS